MTQEQTQQIDTWTLQRDTILSEIATLSKEKEMLSKSNVELAESCKEIENRIVKFSGNIEEIEKRNLILSDKISIELADLVKRKSNLELDVDNLNKEIENLESEKKVLKNDVAFLTDIYGSLAKNIQNVDKLIGHVVKVSEENKNTIDQIIDSVKTSSKEIIEINQKNVKESNLILEKLPAMVVELQRTKLIRHKL